MGLDTSHDCWSGPYGQFMRWRYWLAKQAGIPLGLMQGFYGWEWDEGDEVQISPDFIKLQELNRECAAMYWETLKAVGLLGRPISWSSLKDDPLLILLSHSDCDGRIRWWNAAPIAIRLGQIIRVTDDDYKHNFNATWREGRGCYDGMVPATKRFAAGLLRSHHSKTDVIFR